MRNFQSRIHLLSRHVVFQRIRAVSTGTTNQSPVCQGAVEDGGYPLSIAEYNSYTRRTQSIQLYVPARSAQVLAAKTKCLDSD